MLNALGEFLRKIGFNVDIDVSPTDVNTSLRPDPIIRCPDMKKIFLIDVKIPYDNVELFSNVRTKKKELATDLSRSTRQDIVTRDCNPGHIFNPGISGLKITNPGISFLT